MVLRTTDHIYVHCRYDSDELYDRKQDPAETGNLINGTDLALLASSLRDELFGWLADRSDVIPWDPDPRFREIPHGWRTDAGTG